MDCVFLIVLFCAAFGTKQVLATQHGVTWDVSTDLNSWASGQTFKVGDSLVFKYTKGLHSVVELSSEKEYKNCDISNGINSMNGGNDVVKLTKPGTRYFACGTLGHCDQGMKLKVKTVTPNEASSQSSSSSSASAAGGSKSIIASFVLVLALVLTISLINMV